MRSIREEFYFPIDMPLDKDGNGPATVGVDAVGLVWEVWDQYCGVHGRFEYLADAIDEANRLNAGEA